MEWELSTEEQVRGTLAVVVEYTRLVQEHLKAIKAASSGFSYVEVFDSRRAYATRTKTRRARKDPRAHAATVYMTPAMAHACRLLDRCRATIDHLLLPPDSPIPGQIVAARNRLCELAETIAYRQVRISEAKAMPEHEEAIHLAAQIAALVTLAERREAVVHHIDPDSIARTAAALTADLAAARDLLCKDSLDDALRQARPR